MADGTRQTVSGGGVALRLFTALRVPADVAREVADTAQAIAHRAPGTRPLADDQLHVTFAYLGDVAEEYVPVVARALDVAAASVPGPTSCSLVGAVALGSGRAIALDATLDLHAVLDAARDAFVDDVRPYAPDADLRPWRPHLTMLRAGSADDGRPALALLRDRAAARTCVIAELELFASLPAPGGRVHRLLHAVPFGTHVAAR